MKEFFIGVVLFYGFLFLLYKVLDNSVYCDTIPQKNQYRYARINSDKPNQRQKCEPLSETELLEDENERLEEENETLKEKYCNSVDYKTDECVKFKANKEKEYKLWGLNE